MGGTNHTTPEKAFVITDYAVSPESIVVIGDDAVNHPKHYTQGRIECIDAIKESLGSNQFIGYLRGNIMKYLWRFDKKKNRLEDLKKAQWYLDYLVDYERKVGNHDVSNNSVGGCALCSDVHPGVSDGGQSE